MHQPQELRERIANSLPQYCVSVPLLLRRSAARLASASEGKPLNARHCLDWTARCRIEETNTRSGRSPDPG